MKSQFFAVQLLLSVLFVLTAASSVFAGTATGTTAGGNVYSYHDITLSSPQSGLRLVLSSVAATDFYLYTGTVHTAGTLVANGSSTNKTLHTLLIPSTALTNGASYHVRIRTASGAAGSVNYTFTDDHTYARDLTWDPGTASGGTNIISQPDTAGGDYLFKITTPPSTAYGAWRTALAVSGAINADLQIHKTNASGALLATVIKESIIQDGSDGFVLAPGTSTATNQLFNANQTFYIRVKALPGATWNLYSGDIYAHDLGTLAADAPSTPTVTVGPEGVYYFKTVTDTTPSAWKLWQNGANLPMRVGKSVAPVTTFQQDGSGQLLLVPPYLTSISTFLVGVTASPGTTFSLTSQIQPVIDLAFGATAPTNDITGFGYTTYRVTVPDSEVAWQVDLTRTSDAGNPELYLRKGEVPNADNNSALSEAPAGVADSVTIVSAPVIPSGSATPTLTSPSGTWYITVYGTGTFSYSLANKAPTLTDIPYLTAPAAITNDEPTRTGWRYYRVTNPAAMNGKLGWQVELDQAHRAGYEIAIRLNEAPGRWKYRTTALNGAVSLQESTPTAAPLTRSSFSGIFQDPNHQADTWYIGIYILDQALGPFELTTREIPAPLTNLAQGTATVSGQDVSTWQWFKFEVPNDTDLKGWDLRLEQSTGIPEMVVRRDLLPATLDTSNSGTCPSGQKDLFLCSSWPTGTQWSGYPLSGYREWTHRINNNNATPDLNNYLIMGMGSPLQAGVYYVGVARKAGSTDATPLGYTLRSRGIGLASSSYPIKVTDLNFTGAGSSITASGLEPREVGWYKVTVPAPVLGVGGVSNWELKLEPTVGEAMLAVRHGRLPNVMAGTATSDNMELNEYYAGTLRQKSGNEYFYKSALSTKTTITGGEYYIAVISEGQNPPNTTTIGSGPVSYTLTSVGTIPVADTPPTTLTTATPLTWATQTLPFGSLKAYRFRVEAGMGSVEVRLNNRIGNPLVSIRQDAVDLGKIPAQPYLATTYHSLEGGDSSPWVNGMTVPHSTLITIPTPVAGDYTISVYADSVSAVDTDASYTLEVTGLPAPLLDFTNGSTEVINQDYQTWRYFRVDVPNDPVNLKGWDLRLNVTAGSPRMVVRQDLGPSSFLTSSGCGGGIYNCTSWGSGNLWAASGEWTGRTNTAAGTVDPNSYLIMGMGSPLVAGTYYVGVATQSGTANMSYTLVSRGIGMGGTYPIQVTDLAFAGGSVTTTNLAAREAGWYRVDVPANAASWSLNLVPEAPGEAMIAVRHGRLPNIEAAATKTSDNTTSTTIGYAGTTRQKPGNEYFYKYPASPFTAVTGGEYYIAVISEGQSPANSTTIGSGSINYTLTSAGEMPIDDKTSTPVLAGAPVSWAAQTIPYATEKVYRFRVPTALVTSVDVQITNVTGNPLISIRKDLQGSGRIPTISGSGGGIYPGPHEGGYQQTWNLNTTTTKVTIPASTTDDDYTITVKADSLASVGVDSGFTLEVIGSGAAAIPFTSGTVSVVNQDYLSWKYFVVNVPADASLKGWDLRLKVSAGQPQMVVRRGQAPATVNGSPIVGNSGTWLSGSQWNVYPQTEWSKRSKNADNTSNRDGYLIAGMGSPLEAGTYYIGVARANQSSDTVNFSYTLESRGIGIGTDSNDDPWPIQVATLNFSNGVATVTDLPPREVGWYKVTVPADAASWALNLQPAAPGEAMLAIRQGLLPNVRAVRANTSYDIYNFNGTIRQADGGDSFYKYAATGQSTIPVGDYYIAVISEGQSPPNSTTIGSGPVSYTLTSHGTMPVNDLSAAPVSDATPAIWSGQTVPLQQEAAYRFRLAAGLTAAQVKLAGKSGNPILAIRRDPEGGGRIAADMWTNLVMPHEGSDSSTWKNRGNNNTAAGSSFVTIPSPVAGDYTALVAVDSEGYTIFANASFNLEVRPLEALLLPFNSATPVSGSLGDGEIVYYQVTVPDMVNGYPLLGWQLKPTTTQGAVSIRVRSGQVPGDDNATSVVSPNKTVTIVPPVLTPGVWYIELKGVGLTDYILSNGVITADPARHNRSWTMPAKVGSFSHPGLEAPYFGDSGVADNGTPLPGDQGVELELDGWHYYRITVPENNSGLLRTAVQVFNGRPQIYLRAGSLPGIDHFANAANPSVSPGVGQINAYDRYRSPTVNYGSLFNNWVPLDGKSETQLTPGEWWIGVRAQISSSRYRLKVSVGDVFDTGGQRLDTTGYVQDLAQDGGAYSNQSLLAEDMRYYRVVVPQSSVTPGSGVPLAWNVTMTETETIGDVVVFVRDTIPPGQGANGNAQGTISYSSAASTYFQDWYDDNTSESPTPYVVISAAGTTTLQLPPVEPGKVYYLGVYARTDATFNISSSVGAERLALDGIIPFENGTVTATLAPQQQKLYRIDVPANATVWQHSSINRSTTRFSLHQGRPAIIPGFPHWNASTAYNSLIQTFSVHPWQPGHSYYLTLTNLSSTISDTYTFTMSGQVAAPPAMVTLNVTVSGSGTVTSVPDSFISCTDVNSAGCSADYSTGATVDLSAVANGWQSVFNSWGGDIGSSNGSAGSVTMDAPKAVIANFGPAPNARIAALDYPTILAAYTAAPAGAVIQMKDIVFEETIVLNPVSSLAGYTLKGGFADFAASASGYTTIKGSLKIRNGKLIAERLIIRP